MISSIRPYVNARMNALGYTNEWDDGFNISNIPATKLDKAWHLTFLPVSFVANNQTSLETLAPIEIEMRFKGHRSPKTAIDKANEACDAMIGEFMAVSNWCPETYIKKVTFAGRSIEALAPENDNTATLIVTFNFLLSRNI